MADDKTKALGEATRSADRRLRQAHQDEYNQYKSEEAQSRGVEWTPRLTAEQKAERDLQRLVEQYPHLADKIQTDGVGAVI